ncbi:hypothetical protein DBIPINDM_007273 (plasmid) [Mesorhizobium sp. AR02]|nr:hypothetical protein DBIPINDM_007273 [Mesorhizobium sp. AR02]
MREREGEYIPRLHAETSGIGGATAQHSAPHEAIALPPMKDYDQDLLWGGLDKAGPQPFLGSSARHHQPPDSAEAVHPLNWRNDHQSAAEELAGSNVLPSRQDGGFEAMVHQNPPTSFELNAWVPSPDFPPLFTGPVPGRYQGARQPGSPQELSLVPASSDDEALAWLSEELVRRRMQEPASPSTARAQDLYPGFEALVDPDPVELGYNAHFAPAPSARAPLDIYGDLDSLVDLPSTPVDLRDDAHSAPVRPRGQMVETEWQQMMQGTGSAAVLRQGGPDGVQLIHHTRPRPMSEAAPAAPARAPGPGWPVTAKLPDTYRGLPVVDVITSTTTSSDAQIGALDPTASSNVTNGSVLGATEWLSDAHVQRDYDFVEQQLQGINPMLAARTRLVSPSVSHLLRHMEPQNARGTLQSIYNQNDAPADFLFLPLNNGTPNSPGTHWSLLLVDRRNPERRFAYHYDSLQREGYNDVPARQLARLLNATLTPARMPRQPNDYDCGVFVLEGTWALVGRLVDGQRPDLEPLHLDNLIADRQALQNRLRGLMPQEEEPRQLLDDEPASPPMMAFDPAELRLLLDDEPASSSPRVNSTPHARTDGVHQSTQAPWLPERKRSA